MKQSTKFTQVFIKGSKCSNLEPDPAPETRPSLARETVTDPCPHTPHQNPGSQAQEGPEARFQLRTARCPHIALRRGFHHRHTGSSSSTPEGPGSKGGEQGGVSWSQAAASRAHHLDVYSTLMDEVSLHPHGTFLPGAQMITAETCQLD